MDSAEVAEWRPPSVGVHLDLEPLQHALDAASNEADAVHDGRLPQASPARALRCARATHGLLCGRVHPCMLAEPLQYNLEECDIATKTSLPTTSATLSIGPLYKTRVTSMSATAIDIATRYRICPYALTGRQVQYQ